MFNCKIEDQITKYQTQMIINHQMPMGVVGFSKKGAFCFIGNKKHSFSNKNGLLSFLKRLDRKRKLDRINGKKCNI